MTKKRDAVITAGPTCIDCYYWQRCEGDDATEGECYFNPPLIQIDEDGFSVLRPLTAADERACGRFRAKQ